MSCPGCGPTRDDNQNERNESFSPDSKIIFILEIKTFCIQNFKISKFEKPFGVFQLTGSSQGGGIQSLTK